MISKEIYKKLNTLIKIFMRLGVFKKEIFSNNFNFLREELNKKDGINA